MSLFFMAAMLQSESLLDGAQGGLSTFPERDRSRRGGATVPWGRVFCPDLDGRV